MAPSVDELLPGQIEEIARLGMLVEAAGRLFGTLDLDAVLPDVLDLAQSTLAVDAYSLWRRDPYRNTWTLQASAGLSREYVSAAPAAIQGNENVVALDEPIVMNDITSVEWLTPEHKAAHAAEGTASMLAAPLHHRGDVIGTLVFYSRRPRTFGPADVRAASAVAGLAAAAIGTVSVYQEQARLAESRRLLAEASDVDSRRHSTTRRRSRTLRRWSCPSLRTGASSTSLPRTDRSSGWRSRTRIPRRSSARRL